MGNQRFSSPGMQAFVMAHDDVTRVMDTAAPIGGQCLRHGFGRELGVAARFK
jgi:hypothetical protein